MGVLAHHVLLGLSAAALSGGGLRVAGRTGARGLPRVLAAAALAFAAAVLEALTLGVLGLGGSAIALSAVATATWLIARGRCPDEHPPRAELAAWWAGAGAPARVATAAGTTVAVGWAAWQLRYPYLGFDSLLYHLSLPALWVQQGSPGALVETIPGLPVSAYPVTSEVWMSWALGISRSWVVASVVSVGLLVLTGVAAVVGLRAAGVPRLVAGLGAGALCSLPLVVTQLGGPGTDLAALAWLSVTAALAAVAARDRIPALLAVALVAGGLALGTKTTTALPAAAAILAAAWPLRGRLRSAAVPLGAGALGALLLGALWPLRNLVLHGSPLWPFASGPFGDPLPPFLAAVQGTFAEHPGTMLDGRIGDYVDVLAGGLVVLAAGVTVPFARRNRLARGAGAVALVGVLTWTVAPFTGIDDDAYATGALRYLLPALAVCTAALCLAASGAGRPARRAIGAVLGVALAWSLVRALAQDFPVVPSPGTLVTLAVLGTVGGLAVARLRPSLPAFTAPAAAVVLAVALSAGADGYVERHARAALLDDGLLLTLTAQPGFTSGDAAVAMAPGILPLVAGDTLAHRIVRLPAATPCPEVRRRASNGWFAFRQYPPAPAYARLVGCLAGIEPVWRNEVWTLYGGAGA